MSYRLPASPASAADRPARQQDALRLNVYRLYCVVAGVLLPAFWLAYRWNDPQATDPLWQRLAFTSVSFGLLGLSYACPRLQPRLPTLVHAFFVVVTLWFIGLTARNGFSPDYALGLLFVFASISVAFGTGVRRMRTLLGYLALCVGATVLALAATPEAAVGRILFGGAMLSTAVVGWITAHSRVRLQDSLTASDHTYRQLFTSANDAILVFSPSDGRLLDANDRARATYGYEALAGRSMADLSGAPDAGLPGEGTTEATHYRSDGTLLHVLISTAPIEYAGRPACLSIVRDISDRIEAEREIQRLKSFYEQVLEELPADLAVMDADGHLLFLNSKSVADPELRAWLIGKTALDYCRHRNLDPSIALRRDAHLRRAVAERRVIQFEETIRNRAGEQRHILRIANPILAPDGTVRQVIGYGLDITEREQARRALAEREAQYRTLFESAGDGILLLHEGRITQANSRAFSLFGCTPDELIGRGVLDFSPPLQAGGMPSEGAVRPQVEAALAGTPQVFEWQHRRRDGARFDAEVMLNRIDVGGQVYVQAIVRDITARKQYEQGLIEARDRAEELLRLKTAFLNNMSHEIRTPLTSILGFAELLEQEVEGDARSFAAMIHSGGQRLLDTLNSVLDLAHLEAGAFALRPEPLDVGAALREVVRLLGPLADRRRLALELDLPETPTEALTDRSALHRIFFNLVSNALKFTERGRVVLSVRADAAHVHVAVSDTGIGIAPAFLPHLFDEFKQESSGLARSHEGTGLGLTITKRLVDLLGGRIEVRSTKNVGSTFTVSLPCPPAAEHAAEPTAERGAGRAPACAA